MTLNNQIGRNFLKPLIPVKEATHGEIFQLSRLQEYDNYTQTVASPKMTTSPIEVLIIEDDPAASMVLQQSLLSAGCKVDLSEDGYSALNKLVEKEYELIILDGVVPRLVEIQKLSGSLC